MNKSKLIGTAKKLDVFFKVIQRTMIISMIVVICVMAVLTVVNAVNPDAVIGEDFEVVDLGPVTIELAKEYAPDNSDILAYAWIFTALAAASAGLIYYAFSLVRKILLPMTQGDPFHPDVSVNIRKISWVSIAMGILNNVASVIETNNAIANFSLNRLVDGGQIVSITANYQLDLNFLIVFFILLLMSYIFRYGAELQRFSDETL